jgi:hypothetical protein
MFLLAIANQVRNGLADVSEVLVRDAVELLLPIVPSMVTGAQIPRLERDVW